MKVSSYNSIHQILELDRYPDMGFSVILYAARKESVTSREKATHRVANLTEMRAVQFDSNRVPN